MHRAFCRLGDALDAVEGGEVDFDFVPIENSIDGQVNYNQGALYQTLLVSRKAVLVIELSLLPKTDLTPANIGIHYLLPLRCAILLCWRLCPTMTFG